MPKLLTVKDVAELLQISPSQVKELIRKGLPHISGIGKGYRVIDESLWNWLQLQEAICADESKEEA